MNNLRHFSELSESEVMGMWSAAVEGCIQYSQKIGMSGLSGQPTHNIYTALERAIFNEWQEAKDKMKMGDDAK